MASRVENFRESLADISFGKTTENQVEGICTYALWLQLTLSVYLWLIASVHLCVLRHTKYTADEWPGMETTIFCALLCKWLYTFGFN